MSALPRVPEYAATARIPANLLNDRAGQTVILPSEPGETGEDPGRLSGGAFARLTAETRPLPEGYIVARRPATITRQDNGWVAALEPVPGLPEAMPMRLLPNGRLAVLETILSSGTPGSRFAVTGRVTEFQGANYLLLENVMELIEPREPPPRSEGVTPPTAEPQTRPSSGKEPTAEELIQQLMRDRPTHQVVAPAESPAVQTAPAGGESGEPPSAVKDQAYWPERTLLSDRLVRLVPNEGTWLMAFDDPGRNPTDRPIRVLPSRLLESAINLTGGGTRGVVLVVSGEVTAYRGTNYLLLRKVLVRRGYGNLR
ncbi:MAG: hypothetical protein HRF43_14570 [Phycisphaerae bacterium]|jgi:hypothetical protein